MERNQRAQNWRLRNDKTIPMSSLSMTPDAAKEKFMLNVEQQEQIEEAKKKGKNVCVYWKDMANKEKCVMYLEVESRDEVKPIK